VPRGDQPGNLVDPGSAAVRAHEGRPRLQRGELPPLAGSAAVRRRRRRCLPGSLPQPVKKLEL